MEFNTSRDTSYMYWNGYLFQLQRHSIKEYEEDQYEDIVNVLSLDATSHQWNLINGSSHSSIAGVVLAYGEKSDLVCPHLVSLVGVDETFYYAVSVWDGHGFSQDVTPILEADFPDVNYAVQMFQDGYLSLFSSSNLLQSKQYDCPGFKQWHCSWSKIPPNSVYAELLVTRQTGLKYELVSVNYEGEVVYSQLTDSIDYIPAEYAHILVGVVTHSYLRVQKGAAGGVEGFKLHSIFIISTSNSQVLILDNGNVKTLVPTTPHTCTSIKTMQVKID